MGGEPALARMRNSLPDKRPPVETTRAGLDGRSFYTNIQKLFNMDELTVKSLGRITASPYRQEIELQHVEHRADYATLRVRIREVKRFTIFDIDAATARAWAQAMLDWADRQGAAEKSTGE